MNQITQEQLAILLCVADSASFSVAARQMNVSPKFISKQIARLEATLGIPLFVRSTRHLAITSEGRAMLEYAKTAHQALSAMHELGTDKATLAGTIRLTAPVPLGRKYIALMVADFVQMYPDVTIELCLSDQVVDLHKERFDLAIRIGALPDSALLARRIGVNERILVASPDYLASHGTPTTLDELDTHRLLIFAYAGFVDDAWVLRHHTGQERRIKAKGTLYSDNGEYSDNGDVLTVWCNRGLGISLRERWNVQDDIRAGRLVQVLTDWQGVSSNISFVYPRHIATPRRLQTFMDFVVDEWQRYAPSV